MSDLKELDLAKISELTTGGTSHFKEEVKDLDLALQDLRALKEAESAGKNREDVIDFLDRQINTENVAAYLGLAENDVGELNDILSEIDRIEDVDHFDGEKIEIDQDDLIDLVGGTVNEMKEFIEDKNLGHKQLEEILKAEKKIKNRKTAKKYLEKNIRKSQVGEDVSAAKKDLKNLKEDLQKLKSDESIEEQESGDSEEPEEASEEEASSEDAEDSGDESSDDSEKVSEDGSEDSEESVDNNEEVSETDEDKSEEVSEPDNDDDEQDSEENISEFEEKKQIAEDLDLDLGDEELENFSLDDLKKIKSEKEHREELIEKLGEKGLEEEDLRNSSTSDLEKVAESMDEKDESQEEHEEMREEAEEDLEMLMGAASWDEESDQDSGKNTREKIQDMKQNIKDLLDRSSDNENTENSGINASRVHEVLDQYRDLGSEEASIKTAHVMKGFLEQSLRIEREMTYKELAETMPTDEESMNDLAEFFLKMHREQYTGKFEVESSDEIIDVCEDVIDRMS